MGSKPARRSLKDLACRTWRSSPLVSVQQDLLEELRDRWRLCWDLRASVPFEVDGYEMFGLGDPVRSWRVPSLLGREGRGGEGEGEGSRCRLKAGYVASVG